MSEFDPSLWLRRPWETGPIVAENILLQTDDSEAQYFSLKQGDELFGELQLCSAAMAKRAASESETAWPAWNRLGFSARHQQLKQFLVQLELRSEALGSVWGQERQHTDLGTNEELLCSIEWLGQHLGRLAPSLDESLQLPGPTGEANQLKLGGRGVWLLLLDDPVTPAQLVLSALLPLFCGNSVLIHSSPETGFTWARFAESAKEAGLDSGLVQFLPGEQAIEFALLAAPQLAGIVCLGNRERQQKVAKVLSQRPGALVSQVLVPDKVISAEWGSERLLLRFLCEQTITANLTAVGGNSALLSAGAGTDSTVVSAAVR